MNDFLLLATAAQIAGFPAGLPWPATLTLPQLAALLADGCTGEHRERFRYWCTTLRLAVEAGDLMTATQQRVARPAVRRVAKIGLSDRAPREFSPPPERRFVDVPTVTREAAGDFLQDQSKPETVKAWLASAHLPRHPRASEQSTKPILRQRWQETEILRVISDLGYEAKALPKWIPGKPGVKAKVKDKLHWTDGVFDKAWDRLRKDKRIQESDQECD